jgi:hypothetical protein
MRAQFYCGPDLDEYRVTLLKTLLDGPALEWFIDHVKAEDEDMEMDFTTIVCSLHHRFVTAATAQQASRDFDAVRYNAEEGPLKLMEQLITHSRCMREPLPDFIIRQWFLRLVPHEMEEFLLKHRSLTAEYSTISQLRMYAYLLLDAETHSRTNRNRVQRTSAPALKANPPAPAPRVLPRARIAEPVTRPPITCPPPTDARAMGLPIANTSASNALKRCFKCGTMGHIGSDPACPRYSDQPRFTDRVCVTAQ